MSWSDDAVPIRTVRVPLRLMDAASIGERAENLATNPPEPECDSSPTIFAHVFPGLLAKENALKSDALPSHQAGDFATRSVAAAAAAGEIFLRRRRAKSQSAHSTALSLLGAETTSANSPLLHASADRESNSQLRLSKLLLCRDSHIAAWLATSSSAAASATSEQPADVQVSCSDAKWQALQDAWLEGFAGAGCIPPKHVTAMRTALGVPAAATRPRTKRSDERHTLPLAEYMLLLAPRTLWAALQEGAVGDTPSAPEGGLAAGAAADGGGILLPSLPKTTQGRIQSWVRKHGALSVPPVAATGGAASVSVASSGTCYQLPVHRGVIATAGTTMQRLATMAGDTVQPEVPAAAAGSGEGGGSGSAPVLSVREDDEFSPQTVAAALLLLYCPWTDFVLNHNVDVMQLVVFLDKWGMDAQRRSVLEALPDSFTPEQASALIAAGSSGVTGQLPDAVRHAAMKTLVQQAEELQESDVWGALPARVKAEVRLLAYAHSHNPVGPVETFTRASELLGVIKETIQALQEARQTTVENIARSERTQRDIRGRQSSQQIQQWREYVERQQQALRQHDSDIARLQRFHAEQREALRHVETEAAQSSQTHAVPDANGL